MPIPIDNWQFWATTVIFIAAAAWLLRMIVPIPLIGRRKRRGRRVTLTVKGRGVR